MKNSHSLLLASFCLLLVSCGQQASTTAELAAQPAAAQQAQPFGGVPDARDAAIYQVNVRAFSKEGSLQGVAARLDSIRALGVNVLYLMPIYPIGEVKTVNSPYCIRDYTAVNEEYGTLEDLQELVAGAHARDMAVLMDWVANHTAFDHGWTSTPSWYLQDSAGNILSPPGTGWNDVAQLNFSNQDMRQEMIRAMKYWITTANIDGYRCDYADGPPADFWAQALDTLRAMEARKLLMLAEGSRQDHFETGFDFTFGFHFFHTLVVDVFEKNEPASLIDAVNAKEYAGATSGKERVVRYITNHDVNLEGAPQERFGGKQGSLAAFVVAAYMKGVPMIYNGQEIGYPGRLQFFSRTPIDWQAADSEMLAAYKRIIGFYNQSDAIRRGELTSFSSPDAILFSKELNGEKVLVLVNIRDKAITPRLPPSIRQREWKDAFSGAASSLSGLSLPPYGYMVLKN